MNDAWHTTVHEAGYASVSRLLTVAGGGALAALIAAASPVHALECPGRLGIYRGTTTTTNEIRFTTEAGGTIVLSKGKVRAVYPFTLTHSNGLSRTYIAVVGKSAPNSVLMEFEPDFTAPKQQRLAPFIVTPDLTSGFYYWDEFWFRNQNDLLPDSAWRLVGCTRTTPMKSGAKP